MHGPFYVESDLKPIVLWFLLPYGEFDLGFAVLSHLLPIRTAGLFVIYNNSSWATFGKNIGFYCDDESIKKPFFGDSVRVSYLFSVLLGLFPLFIYISECLMRKEVKNSSHPKISPCKMFLKFYYSGFLYVLVLTEILKVFFTELRPHFYYSCLPNMTNIDCSKGLITDFNCTNDGPHWLIHRDIYKSFPSGHAALSCYSFIFFD
ncbi:Phospholipid phosphatase 3 like protein [Argiope bruennichi]|uniref:Phospholipid phosphatase 3 like protein n=1 Tax=Argiope bruennichi TaxID=94029 RepID=A0A8T0EIA0_ARGBR|nr:Phospholipid phosphatase 3 like protein [Argiope bruennichi]